MRSLPILCFALAAVASAIPVDTDPRPVDNKELMIRQKKLIMLLEHVLQPSKNEEISKIASEYEIESNLVKYDNIDVVKDFLHLCKMGMLPRGEIFSIMHEIHRKQAVALFRVMFQAKDWETFYSTACWARERMNAGMFVYSLNVAVLHHKDTRGMVLPPPYEVHPYYFINSEVIQKAYVMKMKKFISLPTMHEHHGITMDENVISIDANYTGWYTSLNQEQKLSYFTEDVGLNSFYYNFHANYPFWMSGKEYGLDKDRRGELYYYVYQQLLARYYLERLSNGMGRISTLAWWLPVRTGYYSSLKYPTGMEFPYRPNNYNMQTEDNINDLTAVEDLERRIRDAIFSGFAVMPDGTHMSLKKPEDVDTLGKLIETNEEFKDSQFYRCVWMVARKILGGSFETVEGHGMSVAPSVLDHFETSLRDPVFWQLYKRIVRKFVYFKDLLPPYTKADLLFPGVKIESVVVDKLVTFFEHYRWDMSNAVYSDEEEMKTREDKLVFLVRQLRLNHDPFTVRMHVKSDRNTNAVVRIFLGPKRDAMDMDCELNDNRHNFVQLDKFIYKLRTGMNEIERKSSDFMNIARDRTMTRDLLKKIDGAIATGGDSVSVRSELNPGMPDRLLLPKGTKGGMMFQLFMIVTPHSVPEVPMGSNYDASIWNGVGTGGKYMDTLPFGYPFDRPIDTSHFMCPNMHLMEVPIFHKTKLEINRPVNMRVDEEDKRDILV